jgi:hypothetical protein
MARAQRSALWRGNSSGRSESFGVSGRAQRSQLLALSDIRDLSDLGDANRRVATISEIFTDQADLRGVFPLIYRIGLDAVAGALDEGCLRRPDWVKTFEIAFVGRYLDNLHRHLIMEKTTPAWAAVYRGIDDDTATIARTLATALNAHLICDLPEALHTSDVRAYHVVDFITLSRVILRTAPDTIAAVKDCYGTDLWPLYHAPFQIWPAGALGGRVPSSREQLFHSITALAFARGRAMANPLARPLIRAQIAPRSRMLSVATDQLVNLRQLSPAG